jgi:hypothetical protein
MDEGDCVCRLNVGTFKDDDDGGKDILILRCVVEHDDGDGTTNPDAETINQETATTTNEATFLLVLVFIIMVFSDCFRP